MFSLFFILSNTSESKSFRASEREVSRALLGCFVQSRIAVLITDLLTPVVKKFIQQWMAAMRPCLGYRT
jgi:hypothetical protein